MWVGMYCELDKENNGIIVDNIKSIYIVREWGRF